MNDPTVFRLPDLGEGLVEAEIVSWHVGVGDHVTAGQPLVSVETDKAVVEIPSPRSGVVGSLQAAVGDRVAVGAPLVRFGHPGEAYAGVVGDLPSAASPVVTPTAEAARAAHAPVVVPERSSAVRAVLASPSVRQLARELGIDLGRVAGTGPDGTILSADVHAALAARDSALAARDSAVAATDKTAVAVTPVRGVRRAMASRMSDAHARVVPATVTDEADIHAWPEGVQPMPRLIRAVAMAAARVPRLNAAFDDRRWELRANPTVDLGIAMETEEGLFVPVIRDVAARSAEDLAGELGELEAAVRARTIAPDRLRGQTLTLSNFGAIAGRFATMVVVPPQVAIVGAGHAMQRPVVDGTQVVIHRVLPLSLTIDHRVVTGAEAGRFLAALIEDLEQAS